jgi:uncharacterized damage-inducible protein DinB
MTELLSELLRYQWWADSRILAAGRRTPRLRKMARIRRALHHIVGVQRFFLSQMRSRAFDVQREMQPTASFDELEDRFAEIQAEVPTFTHEIGGLDLASVLDHPPLDQMRPNVRTAPVQVVLHSQHHRGQVASRLRALGGSSPAVDYLLRKKDNGRGSG